MRVFTATSSQGLLYAMEMLYTVAGWRVPLVLVNVSRALSAPVTLEPDHNDVLAARDCGALQIHCASCQEVLDSVLIAQRLAEDPRVRLPVLVNLDGFYLSFTREPVEIPEAAAVARFLPEPSIRRACGFARAPRSSQAVAVLGGGPYSYFRYQMHLASRQGLTAHEEICAEFDAVFGRRYGAFESYRLEDAEIVFVMIGSFATKAKDAVERLRAAGERVGLLRPRLLRPWPHEELRRRLAGVRAVGGDRSEPLARPGRCALHGALCHAPGPARRSASGELHRGAWRTGHLRRRALPDGGADPARRE